MQLSFSSLPRPLHHFLYSLFLFAILFIFYSGTLGPYIIGTKLLYGWYFFLYANLGKLTLYCMIIFVLLARQRLTQLKTYHFQKRQLFFLLLSVTCYILLFYVLHSLLAFPSFSSNLILSMFGHVLLIFMILFLILGIFGMPFLKHFVSLYKKELSICVVIATIFYGAIFYVWGFWPYLSTFVLHTEYFLFSLTNPTVALIPPYTLSFPRFSITVAQACSGLDSIFLFSALYIIIGIIERHTLNRRKLLLLFFPALIGTILVNIFRVYILILVGLLISPRLSATLFHTYLGMILFMIYFFLFWKASYAWMRR